MSELGRALAAWLIEHDVHDDIVGASLQATWIDNVGTVHHDPLETIHPPATDPLDSDVGELKALPAILPAELVASEPPEAHPLSDEPLPAQSSHRLWLLVAVVIALGVAIGFATLGTNDVSESAAPRPSAPPPPAPTAEPEAVPANGNGGATTSAETAPAEESPQLAPSGASPNTPLKNTRHRTTKKKLKNPFE
jgi:hypothetical protein